MTEFEQMFTKVFHQYSKMGAGIAPACMEIAKLRVESVKLQNTICQLRFQRKIDEGEDPRKMEYKPRTSGAKMFKKFFYQPMEEITLLEKESCEEASVKYQNSLPA